MSSSSLALTPKKSMRLELVGTDCLCDTSDMVECVGCYCGEGSGGVDAEGDVCGEGGMDQHRLPVVVCIRSSSRQLRVCRGVLWIGSDNFGALGDGKWRRENREEMKRHHRESVRAIFVFFLLSL